MVCLPTARTGSDTGPCGGCSYRSPRVALGDFRLDIVVDFRFDVGVSTGSRRDALRKLPRLLKPPKVGLRIWDTLVCQCLVGDKAPSHFFSSHRDDCNARIRTASRYWEGPINRPIYLVPFGCLALCLISSQSRVNLNIETGFIRSSAALASTPRYLPGKCILRIFSASSQADRLIGFLSGHRFL